MVSWPMLLVTYLEKLRVQVEIVMLNFYEGYLKTIVLSITSRRFFLGDAGISTCLPTSWTITVKALLISTT